MHTESYNKQRIPLKKNDLIYLFSDGYADQFGGAYGKKLMTKQFKELLLSMQILPMNEQGNALKKHIEGRMGSIHEQVDDILVIGIKV